MTTEVQIGDARRLTPHPLRSAILREIHARPFTAIATPARVLHFAFDTTGPAAQADRAALLAFCEARGLVAPLASEKHHRVSLGTTALRWEQHSEFTTFTWIVSHAESARPFGAASEELGALIRALPQAGQLLVTVKLEVEQTSAAVERAEQLFDKSSLAMVTVRSGPAVIASDFRADEDGFVRSVYAWRIA